MALRLERNTNSTPSNSQWLATWAFEIRRSSAQREGYSQQTLNGVFSLTDQYPGCPHCHDKSIFQCTCGCVNCWDGNERVVRCGGCGRTNPINGEISSMNSRGDA